MGREERRRAERQQRRRSQQTAPSGARQPTARATEAQLVQAMLAKLDQQPPAGTGAELPRAASAPNRSVPGAAPSGVQTPAGVRSRGTAAAFTTAASLNTIPAGCDAVADAEPQALGLTYDFNAAEEGEPYRMTIRFEGRRTGVSGKPEPQDRFDVTETIARVVPGSGRVTLSKRMSGIAAGRWEVNAGPVADPAAPLGTASRPQPSGETATGRTGFGPIVRVRAPGVRLSAWPALVGLGTAVALVTQGLLAARLALPVTSILLLALVACLIGLVGGKVYYLAEHPNRSRSLTNMTSGMCLQGFVLAAVGTVVLGALLLGVPVGELLDVTAPGLLFGMAIGRVGCFFGGCCAGRPTRSRWGLWSSDRRLGTRRIPTQLLESTMALLLGVAALLIVVILAPQPHGVVFAGGIAAYTLGRQLLFPLRDLPRRTARGRIVTMAISGFVLLAAVLAAVLG